MQIDLTRYWLTALLLTVIGCYLAAVGEPEACVCDTDIECVLKCGADDLITADLIVEGN